MHIAFSLMVAVAAINLVRSAWARVLWSIYPLVGLLRHRRDCEPLLVRRGVRRDGGLPGRGHRAPARAAAPGRLVVARPGASTKPRPDPDHDTVSVTRGSGGSGWPASRCAHEPGVPGVRARAADRVAADAERDLAHGLRAERRRRRARRRSACSSSPALAFIVGSVMDTLDGRYSRMSGKGTHVRGLPRLDPRPDRGGGRAHGRRLVLRRHRATRSRRRPACSRCSAR